MAITLANSYISAVAFYLSGTEDAIRKSNVTVNTYEQHHDGKPYEQGVFDARMGTNDPAIECQTCLQNVKFCYGHSGDIRLNYPVWNPICYDEVKVWLKLVCFNCYEPIISRDAYMKFGEKIRLTEASKAARGNQKNVNKECVNCHTLHPKIIKDTRSNMSMYAVMYGDNPSREVIYPHVAWRILDHITDHTVTSLGRSVESHPRHMVLWAIIVPPVSIRPEVKKTTNGRGQPDSLTVMIQHIIKSNLSMPKPLPQVIDEKIEKKIFELCELYYNFVKAKDESGNSKSLGQRQRGKGGRQRKTQLGKRVRNMFRGTISGDITLKLDQVGIPLAFARKVQIRETVQEYNRNRLLTHVRNGTAAHPGATKVVKSRTGVTFSVDKFNAADLELGDVVYRDIVDGDPFNFNRQPTLKLSNISTNSAVVCKNPDIMLLRFNTANCSHYGADFDGDEMNGIISSSEASRNEIAHLSSVRNWFISHSSSNPSIGQSDDSIIGLSELTRSDVRLDKYHAMALFRNCIYKPDFSSMRPEDTISGRDVVSLALAETPINFNRPTLWYKDNMAQYIKYVPDEIKVVIEQGKHLAGILDKKNVGKESGGSIYHVVANEYGTDKALELLFDMQQMAIAHNLQCGYTVGIMDMLLSAEAKAGIDHINAGIVNKSRLITRQLIAGEIIPPIGMTVTEFYEAQQLSALSVYDDFHETILRDIDHEHNNLFKLVMTGSKGNIENMYNMVSAVGQKHINGERARQKFGFRRTLVYFPRFDTSPEAYGYISNSYFAGMTSHEYIFNAMAARFDLISKALNTSVTGEAERTSVKNLESIVINNFRMPVKNKNIIEFAYGEDFLDPRYVERIKFPTVMLSDEEMRKRYEHHDFPEFFAAMMRDRDDYRRTFMKIERMHTNLGLADERPMPVNVAKIVSDCLKEYGKSDSTTKVGSSGAKGKKDTKTSDDVSGTTASSTSIADDIDTAPSSLAAKVQYVEALCKGFPYVLTNAAIENAKLPLPEVYHHATRLLVMLLRSYMYPGALDAMSMAQIEKIAGDIRYKYIRALIEPGTAAGIIAAMSFTEPLTQYMLDSHRRSASGGTSKSSMVTTREILAAKPLDKLVNPMMLIAVKPELCHNEAEVRRIANSVEMHKVRQFISAWQIFYEKVGAPKHTNYVHEIRDYQEFKHLNPLLEEPAGLLRWCIRMDMNRMNMVLKNVSMSQIVTQLRMQNPALYIVHTPANAARLYMRVYFTQDAFSGKAAVDVDSVRGLVKIIGRTTVSGIEGLTNATVRKLIRTKIDDSGALIRDDSHWGIEVNGCNLAGAFAHPEIDATGTTTSAILEIARVLGIEAARQKIIASMRAIIDSCNHRHYATYANEMTFTGNVTSIKATGLRQRETSNILLRIGSSSPMMTMTEAALHSMKDAVTGVTAPILLGSVPRMGTTYNSFYVNREFIAKNTTRVDDVLSDL